jgi:hypothetical protein
MAAVGFREREADAEPGSGRRLALQVSTQSLDALAHASQSVAFLGGAAQAVVLDYEEAIAV